MTENKGLIGPQTAAESSIKYFREITGQEMRGVSIEEVEFDEKDGAWYVTLSYAKPDTLVFYNNIPRDYKIFKIDAKTGKIISMKIRNIK